MFRVLANETKDWANLDYGRISQWIRNHGNQKGPQHGKELLPRIQFLWL